MPAIARVSSSEHSAQANHGISTPTSQQPGTINEVSNANSSPPEQENVNEHLLKGMDEVYSPVLKLMKLFGIYYGDTTLKSLTNHPGRCPKNNYLSLTYCVVVVTGLWFNFILAFLGCFFASEMIYISDVQRLVSFSCTEWHNFPDCVAFDIYEEIPV